MEFFDLYINLGLKLSQEEVLKEETKKQNLTVSGYCPINLVNELTQ